MFTNRKYEMGSRKRVEIESNDQWNGVKFNKICYRFMEVQNRTWDKKVERKNQICVTNLRRSKTDIYRLRMNSE